MKEISFVPVTGEMLPRLTDILNYYIEHTTVSFYTEKLTEAEMNTKVFFSNPAFQSFAILNDEKIIGYCTVSPWKPQQAYRHTGEVNIYFDADYTGMGMGGRAIQYLENYAKEHNIHVLIAGLCSENYASRRLFEKQGYEQCAHFKNAGRKFGKTLDTIYFQKEI